MQLHLPVCLKLSPPWAALSLHAVTTEVVDKPSRSDLHS